MIVFHYGIHVDSEVPITGVHSNGLVEFLGEELDAGIDLDWEQHLRECKNEDHGDCGPEFQGETLIGDWKKDDDGEYMPNKRGEKGYSAIVGEVYTQVVWSKHTERHGLCSPCYVGQADVEAAGEFLCYVLPPDIVGDFHVSKRSDG